jgi:DNA polymerase-1
MKKKKKIIIVDAFALIFRAYYALPPFATKDGLVVNAVYGFINTILTILNDYKPDYICVAFDEEKPTFRKEKYVEYKAQREAPPEDFKPQIPIILELLDLFNIKTYSRPGFEADDVIGSICAQKSVDNKDVMSYVLTGDLDTLQLVDDNTHVITFKRGLSEVIEYNEKAVEEKYDGLTIDQIIDMKALKGDSSDNIPGVRGIGEKGAIKLLKEFSSLEGIYTNIDSPSISESLRKKLQEGKDMAFLSKELVTIVTDVDIDFKLEDTQLQPLQKEKVIQKFHELEFKTLLNKLPKGVEDEFEIIETSQDISDASYTLINDDTSFATFLEKLKKQKAFCFDTETTSVDPFQAELVGIAFSFKEGSAYYISITNGDGDGLFAGTVQNTHYLTALQDVFTNEGILKIAHNLKFDMEVLQQAGLELKGPYFDTMIAAYLLEASQRSYGLDDMVLQEFGHTMIPYSGIVGKGKDQISILNVELTKLSDYACEDADYTFRLYTLLHKKLKDEGLEGLFESIEMPLVSVLADMETQGVLVDADFLKALSKDAQKEINSLTKKIHALAGKPFNIASPLQLQEVLFETLGLSTLKIARTKTGYSTSASELEKMMDEHEIIHLISEYRELTKLQSTYLDALPELINPKTGRIHTSYNQTVAATGRLSSTNPNLQNIPIRKELGRRVREAFIAPKGKIILAADYSQIELRLTAHYTNDANLVRIFKEGKDIHTSTAALIHNIPEEQVTKEIRSTAKEINFGIIYGLGPVGLAARTGMNREEAKQFIEDYLDKFPGIREYTEKAVEDAQKKGYAQTLFGRRRHLPDLMSKNNMMRSAAERVAVNMPLQGTAADLIKIAMNNVHARLHEISPESKMLMQIHDELVFEVPEADVEKVSQFVKETMEQAHAFKVPIVVDVATGKNWEEAK